MADNAQSVVNGATTASNSSGVNSTTPVQNSTPSSAATKNTVSGGQNQSGAQTAKSYDENWWKEHQEGIFTHPRFKELTGYKEKYSKAEPIVQFAEQIGGLEPIQEVFQYFGPVYHSLTQLAAQDPQRANAMWSQLLPYLNAIVSGQPFPGAAQPAVQDPETSMEDDGNPEVKMLREELEQLKRRDMMRTENEVKQQQQANYGKYVGMFDNKAKELGIPKEMSELLHNFIASNIGKYMPRDPRSGRQINALDVFSEQAFNQCWEREVEPRYKAITGSVLDKTKATTENGGPVVPDTSTHGKPAANLTPGIRSREERRQAMAAHMKQSFGQGVRR